jgi:hypothetical protein
MMEFKGKATLSEVDEAERRVTLSGTGNDKGGSGSAKMEMKSRVLAVDGGGSEILVEADVDLAGKLVRFGRGMMEGISKQIFKQFAERVQAELAKGEPEAESAEPVEGAAGSTADRTATVGERAQERDLGPLPDGRGTEPVDLRDLSSGSALEAPAPAEAPKAEAPAKPAEAEAAKPAEADASKPAEEQAPPAKAEPEEPARAEPEKKAAAKQAAPLVPAEPAPLDAGALFWTVVWAWIKNLFARIFGRRG